MNFSLFLQLWNSVWRRLVTFVYVCAFSQSESAGLLRYADWSSVLLCVSGLLCLSAGCKTYFDCFYWCGEHAFDRTSGCGGLQYCKIIVCFFPPKNISLSELFVLEERRMRTNAAVALFCTLDLYALRFSIRGKSYSLQYLQIIYIFSHPEPLLI